MSKSPKSGQVTLRDPLDAYLCFGVYSAGLAFNRVYKPMLDRLGLTYSQYLVLLCLSLEDDQRVSDIGERLFLESNTLTPLIKRLEAGGLVERRRDRSDERIVRVSLTAKGRSIAEQAACLPEMVAEATGIPAKELEELERSIVKVRDHLRAGLKD